MLTENIHREYHTDCVYDNFNISTVIFISTVQMKAFRYNAEQLVKLEKKTIKGSSGLKAMAADVQ